MGLVDTFLLRFKPDKPYMTVAEATLFKRLVADGSLTIFRIVRCKKCGGETYKSKAYCSQACYNAREK